MFYFLLPILTIQFQLNYRYLSATELPCLPNLSYNLTRLLIEYVIIEVS